MTERVKLSRLGDRLAAFDYPLSAADAREAAGDVVVTFADGEERLADVLARSDADSFASADELRTEIYANLPTEAVGEPGQSEGDA